MPEKVSVTRRNRLTLGGLVFLFAMGGIILVIAWGIVPKTQLMISGIVEQGSIVTVDQSGCGKSGIGEPASVQFADQSGQFDTSTFSQCFYGSSYNPGDSITIVYLPGDPSVVAPRDELPLAYWIHAGQIILLGVIELPLLSVWLVLLVLRIGRHRRSASPLTNTKPQLPLTPREEVPMNLSTGAKGKGTPTSLSFEQILPEPHEKLWQEMTAGLQDLQNGKVEQWATSDRIGRMILRRLDIQEVHFDQDRQQADFTVSLRLLVKAAVLSNCVSVQPVETTKTQVRWDGAVTFPRGLEGWALKRLYAFLLPIFKEEMFTSGFMAHNLAKV